MAMTTNRNGFAMFRISAAHYLVQAIDTADAVISIRSGFWTLRGALYTARRDRFPELSTEFLIAIMQQVTAAVQESGVLHGCVSRHLLHPARVRMARDAAQRYATAACFDKEQNIVRHQSSPSQDLHGEKVGTGQYLHVRLNELLPRCAATSLGCWRDVVSVQDVADRSIRNLMTQIRQRSDDPVVAPTPVFAGKTDHHRFDFRSCPRAARINAVPRPIELVCNQPPIPGEKGIRFCDACDVLQRFASESFRDLGQRGSLRIRQP